MRALCLGYAVLAFSFSLAQWSVILEVYDQNDAGGQRDSNAGRTVNQAVVSKMLQVPGKEQSCGRTTWPRTATFPDGAACTKSVCDCEEVLDFHSSFAEQLPIVVRASSSSRGVTVHTDSLE
jgi:hypothetical protein